MPRRRRWLRWLIGVGIALIGAVYFFIAFYLERPEGSGPAGPAVDRAPFERMWSERRVRVVGIGDSVTAGLGAKSIERSYFRRVIANPADEFDELRGVALSEVLPNLEFENLAVSGTTSLHHATVVEDQLAVQADDVFGLVFLTTGGNDLIHNYGRTRPKEGAMYGATLAEARPWIQNFERRLAGMLDTITARFPGGCEIYLADIYDPTDGVGDAVSVYLPRWPEGLAIHGEYNQAIRRCAADRANVHVVPLHATFLGHGSHCRQFWRATYDRRDPHFWYYMNIEDPNDRGYDAIRRVFLNTIVEHSRLVPRGSTESAD